MFEDFEITKDIQKRIAAGVIFLVSFFVLLIGVSIVHNVVAGIPLILAGTIGSVVGAFSLIAALAEWWNE